MRDIKVTANQGRRLIDRHEEADLTPEELLQFLNQYENGDGSTDRLIKVIADAFYMGYKVGSGIE